MSALQNYTNFVGTLSNGIAAATIAAFAPAHLSAAYIAGKWDKEQALRNYHNRLLLDTIEKLETPAP